MFEEYNDNLAFIKQMIEKPFVPPGQGALDYYGTHAIRFAWTLRYLRACPFKYSLELGSDGFFIYLQRLIDPTTKASGANFSTSHPSVSDAVFWGDPDQIKFPMYNFNLQYENIPFEDDQLDLIMLCEILEHMPADPMFVLAEINRVLKPGGLLLLTTPNAASALTLNRLLAGEAPWVWHKYGTDRNIYRHCFEYTPKILASALEAAGFETRILTTHSCWSDPGQAELGLLRDRGIPEGLYEDNIFAVARKQSGVRNRWPSCLYA